MTSALAAPERPAIGRAALWAAAAGLAAAAHGGLALMALRQPPGPMPETAAPPAITVELAPMPEAAQAEEERIASDTMNAPDIRTDAPERARLPDAAPPTVEAPPRQELAALAPPPELRAPPLAESLPAAEAEVALPAAEPAPRPRARPEALRAMAVEPEAEAAASQPAARAQVRAPEAGAAAARSSAGSRGVSPARWQAELMAHLERLKRYPPGARRRREEGVVQVRFVVDDGGNIGSARIVRSSGYPDLDEAVAALLRRASPVPAPPPGGPREVVAPVGFDLR